MVGGIEWKASEGKQSKPTTTTEHTRAFQRFATGGGHSNGPHTHATQKLTTHKHKIDRSSGAD